MSEVITQKSVDRLMKQAHDTRSVKALLDIQDALESLGAWHAAAHVEAKIARIRRETAQTLSLDA